MNYRNCPNCKSPRYFAELSDDGSCYEQNACDGCGATFFNDPPRPAASIPPAMRRRPSIAHGATGDREWMRSDVVEVLLRSALLAHPLPWRIEHDWTIEVVAADGFCIAKSLSQGLAETLVAYAESLQKRIDADAREVDRFLRENGIEP